MNRVDRIVLLLASCRMYLEQSDYFLDRNIFTQSLKSGVKNTAKSIEKSMDNFFLSQKLNKDQMWQINDYIYNIEQVIGNVSEVVVKINYTKLSDENIEKYKKDLKEFNEKFLESLS